MRLVSLLYIYIYVSYHVEKQLITFQLEFANGVDRSDVLPADTLPVVINLGWRIYKGTIYEELVFCTRGCSEE